MLDYEAFRKKIEQGICNRHLNIPQENWRQKPQYPFLVLLYGQIEQKIKEDMYNRVLDFWPQLESVSSLYDVISMQSKTTLHKFQHGEETKEYELPQIGQVVSDLQNIGNDFEDFSTLQVYHIIGFAETDDEKTYTKLMEQIQKVNKQLESVCTEQNCIFLLDERVQCAKTAKHIRSKLADSYTDGSFDDCAVYILSNKMDSGAIINIDCDDRGKIAATILGLRNTYNKNEDLKGKLLIVKYNEIENQYTGLTQLLLKNFLTEIASCMDDSKQDMSHVKEKIVKALKEDKQREMQRLFEIISLHLGDLPTRSPDEVVDGTMSYKEVNCRTMGGLNALIKHNVANWTDDGDLQDCLSRELSLNEILYLYENLDDIVYEVFSKEYAIDLALPVLDVMRCQIENYLLHNEYLKGIRIQEITKLGEIAKSTKELFRELCQQVNKKSDDRNILHVHYQNELKEYFECNRQEHTKRLQQTCFAQLETAIEELAFKAINNLDIFANSIQEELQSLLKEDETKTGKYIQDALITKTRQYADISGVLAMPIVSRVILSDDGELKNYINEKFGWAYKICNMGLQHSMMSLQIYQLDDICMFYQNNV